MIRQNRLDITVYILRRLTIFRNDKLFSGQIYLASRVLFVMAKKGAPARSFCYFALPDPARGIYSDRFPANPSPGQAAGNITLLLPAERPLPQPVPVPLPLFRRLPQRPFSPLPQQLFPPPASLPPPSFRQLRSQRLLPA